MQWQKIRRMQPDFPCFMHCARLIIMEQNGLYVLMVWTRLSGKEDIRCAVAGGCDGIRIPKTETAQDVKIVEQQILKAENEFGRPENSTLIMAAIESARGVVKALEICEASKRLFGIALSGGDYTKDLHTHITGTGID